MIFEVIFDSFALLIVGLSFAFAFGFISGVGGVVMSGSVVWLGSIIVVVYEKSK